jgi:hypothetical protein
MNRGSFDRLNLERLLREADLAYRERPEQEHGEDWAAWYAAYISDRLPAEDYAEEPETLPSAEPYLSE